MNMFWNVISVALPLPPCHVLIRAPLSVLDRNAPSTTTSRTCDDEFDFPRLPMLMPCPGPHAMFLILIRVVLPTIEMQSSPGHII
uniref:Uncharacterized protein n=1 Tax=Rhizophora mucronata TaxID=61149 RepID=A0A2P2QXX1_RHIMU